MKHEEILKEIENLTEKDREKYFDKFIAIKTSLIQKREKLEISFIIVVLIFYGLKLSILESFGFGGLKVNSSQNEIISLFILPFYLSVSRSLLETINISTKLDILIEKFYPSLPGISYVLSKNLTGNLSKKHKAHFLRFSDYLRAKTASMSFFIKRPLDFIIATLRVFYLIYLIGLLVFGGIVIAFLLISPLIVLVDLMLETFDSFELQNIIIWVIGAYCSLVFLLLPFQLRELFKLYIPMTIKIFSSNQ